MMQKAQIQDLTDLPMSRLMLQKFSYCLYIVDMIFFILHDNMYQGDANSKT